MNRLEAAFRAHERLLWGLGYRMTGLASDADELVQETFLRALEHPVPDDDRPLRPWLVRVCANLARDRLRARRRRAGPHVWLPAPVPDDRLDATLEAALHTALDARAGAPPDAERRLGLAESARYAFLVALEALPPTQRAVLLLREVFELDVDEVAAALDTTPGAVRVAHHKARRALHGGAAVPGGATPAATLAPTERPVPTDTPAAHLDALAGFLGALAAGDAAGAVARLAPNVVMRNDGGGVYQAARMPVVGAEKVVRFLLSVSAENGETRWAVRSFNGRPGVVLEPVTPRPGRAPRSTVTLTLDAAGRIDALFIVLDPRKLGEVAPV